MEEDRGGHSGVKNKRSTVSPCLFGRRRVGEDGLTLRGDINMLPAGRFRWCCGEGFLDNVGDRGEQQLKNPEIPGGWD